MNYFYRKYAKIKLFISIVCRDYEGYPLDWETSWEVAGIVCD